MVKINKLEVIQGLLRLVRWPALPDLSNSLNMAKLRYIQCTYESPEIRNPDTLAGHFLPSPVRWLSLLQGKLQLSKLRRRPFYYYLIARTKYYDHVFIDSIRHGGVKRVINVGCGADTRAYRFTTELSTRRVDVLECDQQRFISTKQTLARKKWNSVFIQYISTDINDPHSWCELELKLSKTREPVLVMLEGVSPYVSQESFHRFLHFIAANVSTGSRVAYDYQIREAADNSDKPDDTNRAFGLPATKSQIVMYHEPLGYKVEHMELSSELVARLLPKLPVPAAGFFNEDCLLQLLLT